MAFRPLLTKFAVSLSCLLMVCFFVSGKPLCAAETAKLSGIDAASAYMSPQQIEQLIQNTPPEQIQQMLENATPKQTISPSETIYAEEPQEDQVSDAPEEEIDKEITPEEQKNIFSHRTALSTTIQFYSGKVT